VHKTSKIVVNSWILIFCTPRSRREGEIQTVPYKIDVNIERCGNLIFQCPAGNLLYMSIVSAGFVI